MKKLLKIIAILGVFTPSLVFGIMKYQSPVYNSIGGSAASSANGTAISIKNADSFSVYWTVTTTTTPNVVCKVQLSPDGTTWFDLDSQTKTTASSVLTHVVSGTNVNALWVRARTQSVTRGTTTANVILGSQR